MYDEYKENGAEDVFKEKEVLLKIITLMDDIDDDSKLKLVGDISNVTNKQTPVINADKFFNDEVHKKIQKVVFDRYGILYERKRGEFSDGLSNGYVGKYQILKRNLFFRIYYSSNGYINIEFRKKLFQQNDFSFFKFNNESFDRFNIGYHLYVKLWRGILNSKDEFNFNLIRKDLYAKLYAYNQMFPVGEVDDIDNNISIFDDEWGLFLADKVEKRAEMKIIKTKGTHQEKKFFNEYRYFRSSNFEKDVIDWFNKRV
ncbi:AIPR family protein [Candidatus Symbiopectobacterium sp. 'North America']|uniref:AIPR family protein n=1 Tax=Candidatus Symbiopectobacterium sp. 'North America' TaxID=2794574 RepID=UPI001FD2650F|nr:AIPR family protein [Candidatus Symbiopectobacterium sp. 'North America']